MLAFSDNNNNNNNLPFTSTIKSVSLIMKHGGSLLISAIKHLNFIMITKS